MSRRGRPRRPRARPRTPRRRRFDAEPLRALQVGVGCGLAGQPALGDDVAVDHLLDLVAQARDPQDVLGVLAGRDHGPPQTRRHGGVEVADRPRVGLDAVGLDLLPAATRSCGCRCRTRSPCPPGRRPRPGAGDVAAGEEVAHAVLARFAVDVVVVVVLGERGGRPCEPSAPRRRSASRLRSGPSRSASARRRGRTAGGHASGESEHGRQHALPGTCRPADGPRDVRVTVCASCCRRARPRPTGGRRGPARPVDPRLAAARERVAAALLATVGRPDAAQLLSLPAATAVEDLAADAAVATSAPTGGARPLRRRGLRGTRRRHPRRRLPPACGHRGAGVLRTVRRRPRRRAGAAVPVVRRHVAAGSRRRGDVLAAGARRGDAAAAARVDRRPALDRLRRDVEGARRHARRAGARRCGRPDRRSS